MLTDSNKNAILLDDERRVDFLLSKTMAQSRVEKHPLFSHPRNVPFLLEGKMAKGFQKDHKGFRKKIRIKKSCEYCKKDTYVAPCLLKIGSGKFCDMNCYVKWQTKNRTIIRRLSILLKCSICKRNESIIIHHKDRDNKNDRMSNLMILCQSCHVNLHNKIEHKTRQDSVRSFICCICNKKFKAHIRDSKERKVCSSECSYEYSRRGLHWRNREH